MPDAALRAGPLAHLRVVDLSDKRGWLAGRILSDLGAAVIKIEPPGGDPERTDCRVGTGIEPGGPNPAWLALNRGKRSATLDIRTGVGRDLMLALVRRSDVVIESFPPGGMAELGLGYKELAQANPAVVLVSITAFGQTGPYAGWAASDIVVGAMGGAVWPTGEADRPPVRIGADQYFLHASTEGALHAIGAAYHAARTGQGQHVDVSAQLAAVRTLMNATQMPHTDGTVMDRRTFGGPSPGQPYQRLYSCADGYVMISPSFGPGPKGVVDWLREERCLPPELARLSEDRLTSPTIHDDLPEFAGELSGALAEFFTPRLKRKLINDALARRLMLVGVSSIADLVADEHLAARGYFAEVDYDGLGALTIPWEWVKMTASPLVAPTGSVPPGADNVEVWCRWAGLAVNDLAMHQHVGLI